MIMPVDRVRPDSMLFYYLKLIYYIFSAFINLWIDNVERPLHPMCLPYGRQIAFRSLHNHRNASVYMTTAIVCWSCNTL